ncbi:hypothetical protein AMS68_004935 [Peltaster fructicola]|uniref:Uncharacterized protein n=1 Tax=Peltaster fructicola TaxID=286661 RepID=A0A6H0XXV0_9PEZI|nr:hypothetical protein AMS68_004935 [Peltaster fructicola]
MFSRARRNSRIQAKQKPEISQEPLPTSPLGGSISLSTRSDSPALPSPLLPWADMNRPSSADGIRNRKSAFITGPPVLPPIRLSSAQNLMDNADTGSLQLDFTTSIPAVDSAADGTSVSSRKGKVRKQRSHEDSMRQRSTGSPSHAEPSQIAAASAITSAPIAPDATLRTASRTPSELKDTNTTMRTTAPDSSSLVGLDTSLRTTNPPTTNSKNVDASSRIRGSTLDDSENADRSLPIGNPTPSSLRAPDTFLTASPVLNSVRAPSTYRTASPAPSSPRTTGTFPTTSLAFNGVKVPDSLPLRERNSIVGNVATTYITQDPMFPRSAESSPLLPRFPPSTSSTTGRDSPDTQGRRALSGGDSDVEHKRKSRRVGKAVTGPTMILPPQSNDARDQAGSAKPSNIIYESPKMEANMFPTFHPPQPIQQSTPIMDRDFIDSRDRPYSQAKPRSLNNSGAPNFARPGYNANYNSSSPSLVAPAQTQQKPISPVGTPASLAATNSGSTIGISFESTSAAFPAPQLVSTRPKNAGAVSTVAGVQVPTHHTSGTRLQETGSISSKAERRRTKLLNPMALLSRRKSAVETTMPDEEGRRALSVAQARQKTVATVGIDKIPEDFDPRIKGKIVHDFSAPRSARTFGSPTSYTQDSPISPMLKVDLIPDNPYPANAEPSPVTPGARKNVHTPVFHEHFEHVPPVAQQSSTGGVGAERRENKDFLARFSQQSSASTVSQESAVLPPFARRSQILDPHQAAAWRDDDGSWSSGRDSGGGRSSTGPLEIARAACHPSQP